MESVEQMSQLPRTWEPKKGAGDTEVRMVSPPVEEVEDDDDDDEEEDEEEEENPTCCVQIGIVKMTPQQFVQWKSGLLAGQPKLTAKDIRRYRLKHHHVICLELEEEGLYESARYIRHLLQFNVEMRREAGPDSLLWRKPKLRDSKEYLDKLREWLSQAERAQQGGKLGDQCTALLCLTMFFMSCEEAWWWVTEQLFLWVVAVAQMHRADGGRLEAITRYIYGQFLLKQMDDVHMARRQLQIARSLSSGKDWDASKELGQSQESVFRETCSLLYKTLIIIAQQVREENPGEAIRLCSSALRRARDSERKENEAAALYELALSYQQARENAKSLELLAQYLTLCTELTDAQGRCNAHLEMAICYKNLQDASTTFEHLELYLKIAEENYLTERRAEANRYLGEYHLNMGNYSLANSHFSTSFSLYFKLSMMEETEQVRCLQGIAAGHQLMPDFTRLLLDAQDNPRDERRLVRWKAFHRPFWDHKEAPFIREDDEEYADTPPESTSVSRGSAQTSVVSAHPSVVSAHPSVVSARHSGGSAHPSVSYDSTQPSNLHTGSVYSGILSQGE